MGEQEAYEEVSESTGLLGGKKILVTAVIILVAVALLIGFFAVSKTTTRSRKNLKYITIFERLETTEASKLREELSYEGFHFKTKVNGKFRDIEIRSDEADDARIKMAQKGLPSGGVVGFEIFDKSSGMGATDFDKRIKFLRALSGELSRNISRINSIATARVQIVLPEDKPFAVNKPKVTASVLVQKRKGEIILPEQVRGIMHLVAASVESLDPENVTVIDMDGTILSDIPLQDNEAEGKIYIPEINAKEEALIDIVAVKNKLEVDITEKVVQVLGNLYPKGSTHVVATVQLDENLRGLVPQIKQQVVLILVDTKHYNIDLTQSLKNTTYTAVASVIAYKKGRDAIVLRRSMLSSQWQKPVVTNEAPETVESGQTVGAAQVIKTEANQATAQPPYKNEPLQVKEANKTDTAAGLKRNAFDGGKKANAVSAEMIKKQYKYFNGKIVGGIAVIMAILIVVSIILKKRGSRNSFYSDSNFEDIINKEPFSDESMDEDAGGEESELIKQAVDDDPEKIASLLRKWFEEDGNSNEYDQEQKLSEMKRS